MIKIICILIVASTCLLSQEVEYIYLNNGSVIKGTTSSDTNDSTVTVETENGSRIKLSLLDILKIEKIPLSKNGSIGFGIGMAYSLIGINLELPIIQRVNFSGGFGSSILAGLGYNFGLKYYFRDIGFTWRPRLSIHYGTVSAQRTVSPDEVTDKIYQGTVIGLGQQWMFGDKKNIGFDFDIYYIISKQKNEDEFLNEIETPIIISIGFRIGF